MNQHIDPNEALYKKLAELENKLNSSLRSRTPYIADWNEVSVGINGTVSEQAGSLNLYGILEFTDFGTDLRQFFHLGDKVRFKQGADYLYGNIISRTETTITVYGGEDYIYTNGEVTDFAYSWHSSAEGFPPHFTYTPKFGALSGMTLTEGGGYYALAKFHISGRVLYYYGEVAELVIGGTPNQSIYSSIPVPNVLQAPGGGWSMPFLGDGYIDSGRVVVKNYAWATDLFGGHGLVTEFRNTLSAGHNVDFDFVSNYTIED